MVFLQGPFTSIHRLTDAPVDPPDSLAAVVPMVADDVDEPTVERVLAAVTAAGADPVLLPVRGPPGAVRSLGAWVAETAPGAEVLWCNSPQMEALGEAHDLPLGGKGSDVWLALGPAAAAAEVVCCVDADVASVTPAQVRRLAAPVDGTILAAKAAYTRVDDGRLFGRLCRLLVRPLLLAAAERHDDPLLSYLLAFRYPLSGEVAVHASLVDDLRLPAGMGLEVGTLGELYRLAGVGGTAQVDLGNHRHAHRPVDGEGGLVAIAPEIVGALARVFAERPAIAPPSALVDDYVRWADRLITQHARDARVNGLAYDPAAERSQVERYRRAVDAPATGRSMPAWSAAGLTPAAVRAAGCVPDATRPDP